MVDNFRVISAFRRNPNLKELLVRAKLKPPMTQGRLPIEQRTTKSQDSGITYPIPYNILRFASPTIDIIFEGDKKTRPTWSNISRDTASVT